MVVRPTVRCTPYLACPACGKADAFMAGHLPAGVGFGPWYCDACGASWVGRVLLTGACDLTAGRDRRIHTYVLLRRGDLYLVVKGMRFEPSDPDVTDEERHQFYYDEHTCPVNYLGVEAVLLVENGQVDSDPHGVFTFVASVDQDQSRSADTDWTTVFPMLAEPASPKSNPSPRSSRATCINCGHRFVADDQRCSYGAACEVGPFCAGCYAVIKLHEEPPAARRVSGTVHAADWARR